MSLPYTGTIVSYSRSFEIDGGTRLVLKLGLLPPLYFKTRIWESWTSDTTADAIVRYVGRKALGLSDNQIHIEPSQELGITINSKGESPLQLLKNLALVAKSKANGLGTYKARVLADGSLVFAPKESKHYKANTEASEYIYTYGRQQTSPIITFESTYAANAIFSMGAAGFQTYIYDRKNKIPKNIITNDSSMASNPGLGKYVPPASKTPYPLRLGFKDEQSARAYAQNKFEALQITNVTATATMVGDPRIDAGDVISILVTQGGGQVNDIRDIHPSSGSYHILEITDSISSDGGFTTELKLGRRGGKFLKNLISGVITDGSNLVNRDALKESLTTAQQKLPIVDGPSKRRTSSKPVLLDGAYFTKLKARNR